MCGTIAQADIVDFRSLQSFKTRGSAIAEELRDALRQLKYYGRFLTELLTRSSANLGTCESFFCVRMESRIEAAVRFDFESNFRIESAVYTTQAVTPSNELQGAPCRRTV